MKKNIFKFLIKAYQKPRLFIQLIAVKFKQIWQIAIVAILLATTALTIGTQPVFNEIAKNISNAGNYLPDYHYQEGELRIDNGDKPLYYQSDSFQLVIDDTIEISEDLKNTPFENTKAKAINPDIFISLFMFKNRTFATFGSQVYTFSENGKPFVKKEELIMLLNALIDRPVISILSQWISYLIITIVSYLGQMLLLALLTTNFNRRISTPFSYKQLLKLTIAITFLPYILIQLIRMVIPSFFGGFFLLAMFLMTYLLQTVKQHTLYVKEFLLSLTEKEKKDLSKFNNFYPELDYMEVKEVNDDIDNPKKVSISPDIFTGDEFNKLRRADIIVESKEDVDSSEIDSNEKKNDDDINSSTKENHSSDDSSNDSNLSE